MQLPINTFVRLKKKLKMHLRLCWKSFSALENVPANIRKWKMFIRAFEQLVKSDYFSKNDVMTQKKRPQPFLTFPIWKNKSRSVETLLMNWMNIKSWAISAAYSYNQQHQKRSKLKWELTLAAAGALFFSYRCGWFSATAKTDTLRF